MLIMKRISAILICMSMLAACVGIDDVTGNGTGSTLHEYVIPASVCAGGEGVIQWNGFKSGAAVSLVSESGQKYELEVGVITASGLIFYVPASVPAGVYELQLTQGETISLGQITVHEAEIPVRNITLASSACLGEELLIKGIGFDEDAYVVLTDAAGASHQPEVRMTAEGLVVVVPEDMEEGIYQVWLHQGGGSWLISSSLELYNDIVIKEFVSVSMYAPYLSSSQLLYTWDIVRDEQLSLVISEYLVEDGTADLSAYDSYVSEDGARFVLEHDGFESSNDLEMTYTRDADGLVTVADVLIYGNKQTTPFTWSYNADGLLTEIVNPKMTFRSLSYDDGNLTVFRNTEFEYADPNLVNHPYAVDVVWAYMSMMEKNDPFVYFPYLLGWYRPVSAQLPTSLLKPSPSGSGSVKCVFTYQFDGDGYVSEVSWVEDGDNYRLVFAYGL